MRLKTLSPICGAVLAGFVAFWASSDSEAQSTTTPCSPIEAETLPEKYVPSFNILGVEYLTAKQVTKSLYFVVGKKQSEQDILRVIFLETVMGETFPMLEKSVEGQCYDPQFFSCPGKNSIVSIGSVGCDAPRMAHILVKRGENDYKDVGTISLDEPASADVIAEESHLSAQVTQERKNFEFDLTQTLAYPEQPVVKKTYAYQYTNGELAKK